MRISKIKDVEEKNIPQDGYPIFSIDGRKVDPNGLEREVAGGVYSIAKSIYDNSGLDGLLTRDDILRVINEGVIEGSAPSIVVVAKKFPSYIANYLLKVN